MRLPVADLGSRAGLRTTPCNTCCMRCDSPVHAPRVIRSREAAPLGKGLACRARVNETCPGSGGRYQGHPCDDRGWSQGRRPAFGPRGPAVAPVHGLARRTAAIAGLHHLSERQAVPARRAARRRPFGVRAHVQPCHGPRGPRPAALPVDALPALAPGGRARTGREPPGLRPALRAAPRLDHGRPRHPRHRHRAGRTAAVRQHPVLLPRLAQRHPQLRSPLAAALRQPARRRGPLPSERPRHARRPAGLRHRRGRQRRRRRLARAPPRRRRRDRRRQRRDGRRGLSHAALAALARCRRRRSPVAARQRHRALRLSSSPASGRFEEVAFCPGYARGLALPGASP